MIITRTPLRISFTGGGTDLPAYYENGYGAVVSTAINKFVYITVNKRFDNTIRLSYSKTEIVNNINELQHDIAKACLNMVGITGGVEITSIADIPSGTGLGSSSSFTVGLLNALYTYVGEHLSADELAKKACEIEIDILHHPIGKQDQYAAAVGGINYFSFERYGAVKREKINLSDADIQLMNQKLMMFYTGIRRSADNILEKQSEETKNKLPVLDFMKNQANEMKIHLKKKGFDETFAEMLDAGWQKKKSITSGISNQEIDELYERALQAGALGGKLLGAGGGGFILLYCDEQYQQDVRKAMSLRELDFNISRYGSQVVYFEG
ncbi:MAG: GHMP kinase [Limosilactobacillus oris]|jgi:D-glycero-alpha-D-manno-heptose-7-phosphate kinase|uniref:GHMP family kinase ATP-binding protein n=1 Tax=Megasphaera sp. TaxID=2023260 RepID=UPI0025BD47E7|nr:GHMP kinase [Megasphaera sp.]MCH3903712.1 GHMP kinase [Limosilactobacillus oris]MCH3931225.1 GHMP kinase [Megasphaera sp.]